MHAFINEKFVINKYLPAVGRIKIRVTAAHIITLYINTYRWFALTGPDAVRAGNGSNAVFVLSERCESGRFDQVNEN